MLPKQYRINQPADFTHIFKTGHRSYAPGVRIFSVPNTLGYNRYGFVASTKVGNSVVRHHIARVLRATVKDMLVATDGHDYVVIAQPDFEGKFNSEQFTRKLKKK